MWSHVRSSVKFTENGIFVSKFSLTFIEVVAIFFSAPGTERHLEINGYSLRVDFPGSIGLISDVSRSYAGSLPLHCSNQSGVGGSLRTSAKRPNQASTLRPRNDLRDSP